MSTEEEVGKIFKGFDLGKGITEPKSSSKIYKSECVLSHNSPRDKGGLFVCLKTLLAFGEQFVERYVKVTSNPVFLNLKEIPVDTLPQEEQDKIIAETNAKNEKKKNEKSETPYVEEAPPTYVDSHSLVVFSPDLSGHQVIKLPSKFLPLRIQKSIDFILRAESVKRKNEATSWEEILQPSKYSNCLKQIKPVKIPMDSKKWKCSKCDKRDNLWLNLSDGYIGCGRINYSDRSLGGNDHGVNHFKETGFPLVVKLGTITPEGADVWEYGTNKMVIDTQLKKHLLFFGIDMNKMVKTDKTMTELSINLMLKYESNVILEKNTKKKLVFGKELTGLKNIGNQCYMNALLQVLFSLPEVKSVYYDEKSDKYFEEMARDRNRTLDPSNIVGYQMRKMCTSLNNGVYSKRSKDRLRALKKKKKEEEKKKECIEINTKDEETEIDIGQDGISPISFKTCISKGHNDFSRFRQQDPSEYYAHLMKRIGRSPHVLSGTTNDITNIFKFQTWQRLKCSRSGKVRLTTQDDNCIHLRIERTMATNYKEYSIYEKFREEEEKARKKLSELRKYRNIKRKGLKKLIGKEKELIALEEEEKLEKEKEEERKKNRKEVKQIRPIISMLNLFKVFGAQESIEGWTSPVTNTKVTALKSQRFKTFPKYLFVILGKYYITNTGDPMKIDLSCSDAQNIDISFLKSKGLEEGEEKMIEVKEKKIAKSKPKYDENLVKKIVEFGIPEIRAKRACIATKNANIDAAVSWVFSNTNNPDIDKPLEEDKEEEEEESSVDENGVTQLMGICGCSKDIGTFVMKKTNNNWQRGVTYFFNNQSTILDEMKKDMEAEKLNKLLKNKKVTLNDGNGQYSLCAFISHLGGHCQSGHYVCHIKKGDKWYLYNDESVSESQETPFDRGYVYFYKRND